MHSSKTSIQTSSFSFYTLLLIFIFTTLATIGAIRNLSLNPPKKFDITYHPSLTTTEITKLQQIFHDFQTEHPIEISATTVNYLELADNQILFDIQVPVANFYYPASEVSSDQITKFTEPDQPKLISINQLTSNQKLLSLDGHYLLDDFKQGGIFRIFQFSGQGFQSAKNLLQNQLANLPTKANTLSFAQTGVTALSRAMTTKLHQIGDPLFFAKPVQDFLSSKDLTHISNEVSFAKNCPGGTSTTSLCADWQALETIKQIGTDIIELTGNHNNDYGFDNHLETLNQYQKLGLQTFGGGKNAAAAAAPLQIQKKGTHLTLLGYNQSTSTTRNGQLATAEYPGANPFSVEVARKDIADAKARGDFVIVSLQFFECNAYVSTTEDATCDAPIANQTTFFRSLIDLGADLVIGTQAHQPQTFELYQDKPIFYGLGNLFFDQAYWPGTTRSLILTHYFINGHYRQTRITPTAYDRNFQTKLLEDSVSTWLLARLTHARP